MYEYKINGVEVRDYIRIKEDHSYRMGFTIGATVGVTATTIVFALIGYY